MTTLRCVWCGPVSVWLTSPYTGWHWRAQVRGHCGNNSCPLSHDMNEVVDYIRGCHKKQRTEDGSRAGTAAHAPHTAPTEGTQASVSAPSSSTTVKPTMLAAHSAAFDALATGVVFASQHLQWWWKASQSQDEASSATRGAGEGGCRTRTCPPSLAAGSWTQVANKVFLTGKDDPLILRPLTAFGQPVKKQEMPACCALFSGSSATP